jgi:transposase-like protein
MYRLTDGEWYDEILEDIRNLLELGLQIESVTCDGHRSILKATRKASKDIIIQRCVIHVQRMCRIWLTLRPQSQAGIDLRRIVSTLHLIENREQWGYWVVELIRWSEKYNEYINQKSFSKKTGRFWYTHKMVRRSFVTIKNALPDMFHYLENPRIPKSTNGLESFFGHLKQNISLHRGLSKEHFRNYLKWYLFYKNNK